MRRIPRPRQRDIPRFIPPLTLPDIRTLLADARAAFLQAHGRAPDPTSARDLRWGRDWLIRWRPIHHQPLGEPLVSAALAGAFTERTR